MRKIKHHKVKNYWQKLVNTDSRRSVLVQYDYHKSRFGNAHIQFHIFKSKFINDYNVAMEYLNE